MRIAFPSLLLSVVCGATMGSANALGGVCGNGTVESPEICDQGPANGLFGSCCTGSCGAAPVTTDCRAAGCSAGTAYGAAKCWGSSTLCPDSPAWWSCGAYVCSGTQCASSCSSQDDCATGQCQ